MAFDTFLEFTPAVAGESTDSKMAGKIEIYSFSWGASNPVTIGSGKTGIAGGKVSLSSFNIMKKTEKSSPILFQSCCSGQHYDKATVTMRKAAGDAQSVFQVYEFENVMIESIQWSGSSGGDDTPTESVSIAYGKVTVKYQPQKAKDGKIEQPIITGWDQTTNVKS